jgi:hypothetical protein
MTDYWGDPMSDGFWLKVQDERVAELECEVERLTAEIERLRQLVPENERWRADAA